MNKKQTTELRFKRFDELMERYGGSPKRFCEETGYSSQTIISQLKGRKRSLGDDLARQIEAAADLPKYALENPDGLTDAVKPIVKQPIDWPFSFTLSEFVRLSRATQSAMDEAFTNMVIGAQTRQLLDKPKKSGR